MCDNRVVDFEPGARAVFQPSAAIQRALESAGIEFIAENRGNGVRRRKRKGEAMSGRRERTFPRLVYEAPEDTQYLRSRRALLAWCARYKDVPVLAGYCAKILRELAAADAERQRS